MGCAYKLYYRGTEVPKGGFKGALWILAVLMVGKGKEEWSGTADGGSSGFGAC